MLSLPTVMRWLVGLLVCWVVVGAQAQTYPTLTHSNIDYANNSFLDKGTISQTGTLICKTDHTPCCTNDEGGWSDPAGTVVHEGVAGATELYVTRSSDGEISLHRL